ncbi:MAG TPA: hypothetical protein VLY23_07645 [Candidatus Acidoferrum sp.]|nr:hypothetical protein [Candidatus Acidoferrum sp.]
MHIRDCSWSVEFLGLSVCALLLGAAGALGPVARKALAQTPEASKFHEEVIAELSPGSELKRELVGVSHLAWVESLSGKRTVRLDGKQQGGVYDDADYLSFNADEKHFGFFAKRGSAWTFVLDGQEHSPEYAHTTAVDFQPKGDSIAYCACREKRKCRLVVDGTEMGDEYEDISYPQYSRDGKRLAYLAKRNKKWIAVVDGKELGPDANSVWFSSWGFSRDGSHFFVAAATKNSWGYAVDGTPGPDFEVISRITFSHDGQHYAYGGTDAKAGFKKQKTIGTMILDGQSVGTHEGRGMVGAWSALAGSAEVMTGGVRELTTDFHGISTPQFNPEGKLVYAARRDKGDVAVFVGDDAGPGFDEILSRVAFSEDSQHFAYIAKHGDDFVEVRDNQPGRTIPAGKRGPSDVDWIAMSHDAKHLAYETVSGGNQYKSGNTLRALRSVIIDGQTGPEYDAKALTDFVFDADAHHYFYEVLGAKGDRDLVNVDGHESSAYDWVAFPRFVENANTVMFIARDGARLLRVTYALGPGTAVQMARMDPGR